MSGGFFNYHQYQIEEIADQIDTLANGRDFEYNDYTRAKFLEAVTWLKRASVFVNRIDWLLSGDDGEETFHKRLAEDLRWLREGN
jgi:hypothetical protein